MTWNFQSYIHATTVLNEKMWHFVGLKQILTPPTYFQWVRTPSVPHDLAHDTKNCTVKGLDKFILCEQHCAGAVNFCGDNDRIVNFQRTYGVLKPCNNNNNNNRPNNNNVIASLWCPWGVAAKSQYTAIWCKKKYPENSMANTSWMLLY